MRRMVEKGEGESPSRSIHHTHLVILRLLKHFLLFSVDIVEKRGFVQEKDENRDRANVARLYILSIEEIYSLDQVLAVIVHDGND
jgi:hypothetical protein